MAAALWAMRPLRRNPHLVRQFLGWLICGVAFGCAALTSGPAALPVVILPVIAIAAMCPHRVGHALGIVAAIAVAALLVAPWTIYVHEAAPEGWQNWLADMMPPTTESTHSIAPLPGRILKMRKPEKQRLFRSS